ncbi:MAG TPA: 50S ribosomal protein L23 [Blastocatellia bacterium]|nr:50S ribosomal protein L23 [Blastocatellia bacterium]
MKTIWDVLKTPVITEKALKAKEAGEDAGRQVLAFRVDGGATKHAIRNAVEKIFKVRVDDVRIINYRGKEVRRGRHVGRKPDWKKAYVTLAQGERQIDYGDSI